jgi:hypothetical protein
MKLLNLKGKKRITKLPNSKQFSKSVGVDNTSLTKPMAISLTSPNQDLEHKMAKVFLWLLDD